ncbi:serine/threonine protein kinase [Rivularia sp. PCC 7116]|uniref:serine/threonine protein kinase n=1 Tax=Rivularia sp. PCC 7116 TaxID=373994 RepID=UPI00029EF354|nr:serine/threonine-protein kinase [Rivularia sp. PCC 7116]AFY57794.1 serine/threonine protein kinase [Rivularia sp. PCC 7116]
MNKKIIGDRYEVINLLGKKPGYRTMLCNDMHTQQLVVVKFLIWDDDFEWQNLKLFEREAQILQSISHPEIPRYLDYFEVSKPHLKGFCLVQTYIKAASLEEHLQTGRTFGIEEVKQLAESVLKILIYLHSQQSQIIHRNIKPSNILLTNRSGNCTGDVYLVDFGSVKTLAAAKTATMTVVGTYGYMSPEHFGGKVIPSSDLYSLGATLIYLVTGIHPANLPQKNGRMRFAQLVNCPQGFSNWLKRMIEPVEELRFDSAEAALQGLQQTSNYSNNLFNNEHCNSSHNLINFKKPFGSKIFLKNKLNRLEVVFPRQRISALKYDLLFLFIKLCASVIILPPMLLTICIFFNNIFYGLAFTMSMNSVLFALILLLFNIAICGTCIAFLVNIIDSFVQVLIKLLKRENIKIEQQQLCLSFDWLCFKSCFLRSISLKNITKLEKKMIAGSNHQWDIVANFGTSQYKLFDNIDLTEVEVDWLCSELNEYLNR